MNKIISKHHTKEKDISSNRFKNFFKDWIIPIFAAITLSILINKFLLFNAYIPSGSMVPTINKDDRIIVLKIHEQLHSGQIVVFYSQELSKTLIKRLIGLPGDHIEIKNGIVYRNGEKLEENYVKNNYTEYNGVFDVPEGKYFFLGDNRANSKDSRFWCDPYIDESEINGIAYLRYYPLENITVLK